MSVPRTTIMRCCRTLTKRMLTQVNREARRILKKGRKRNKALVAVVLNDVWLSIYKFNSNITPKYRLKKIPPGLQQRVFEN